MIISDQEVSWAYLLGPCFQLQNTKGVPLTGGYIEVYIHGTRDKYYCASDFAGTLHPFQIPLDSLGSNIVLASTEQAYDVYVYNRFGSLIMSRYNVIPINGTSEGGGGTSNISITSSDGTITVTDTIDPETGIKTYDLSVPWASGDASYWHGRGASNQGQLISDTDTHVLAISEHAIDHEGGDITVGSDGKFHLKEGVYFWTVNVDLYSDSLSNNTQQIYINSNINRASYKMDMTRDNQHSVSFSGITVATQDDFQEGFTIKTEGQTIRAGIYEVAIHKLNPKVLGTKYETGYGIVIEDDTISVDPEVIPSVSTVSGMIQEAVTSIPEYTAGEYIKIEDNEISVTGLQPAGDYLTPEDLNGYATESFVTGYVDQAISEIPEQVQSDWDQTDDTAVDYIKNKPDLDIYATHDEVTSAVTSIDLSDYATHTEVYEAAVTAVQAATGAIPEEEEVEFEEIDLNDYALASAIPDVSDFTTHAEVYDTAVTAIQLVTGMIPDVSDFTTHTEVYEATVTAIESATAVIPDTEEVEFEEINLSDYALASAIPDVSDFITHDEVNTVSGEIVEVTTEIVNNVSGDIIETVNNVSSVLHEEIQNIPEQQQQADWDQTDDTQVDYIKNKPDLDIYATHDEVNTVSSTIIETVNNVSGEIVETVNNVSSVLHEEMIEIGQAATGAIPDVSDFTTHDEVHESIVTAVEYVTGLIPDVSDYATNSDVFESAVTSIQLVTGLIPTDYATDEELQDAIELVTGKIPELPDEEEVEFEEINLSDYALVSAIPDISNLATKAELQDGLEFVTGLIPTDYATHDEVFESSVTAIQMVTAIIPEAQVQSDWTETDTTDPSYIQNKPNTTNLVAGDNINIIESSNNLVISCTAIPVVTGFATKEELQDAVEVVTGLIPTDYATDEELQDAIELVTGMIPEAQVQSDWTQNDDTQVDYIKNKPAEYTVVAGQNIGIMIDNNDLIISASGTDLTGYVTDEELQDAIELVTGMIPEAQVQSDWAQNDDTAVDYIKNKPNEYTVVAGQNIGIMIDNNDLIISASGTDLTGYVTDEQLQDGLELVTGMIPDVSDFATHAEVNNVSGAIVNEIPDVSDFVTEDQVTALLPEEEEVEFEEIDLSNYALASAIPDVSNLATKAELQDDIELVTGMIPEEEEVEFEELDLSDYALASAIPDISNLATKAELQDGLELVTGLIPEAQVQSDWTEADSGAVDYIKNKPQNLVQDASYVHTDNNFTNLDKNKLDGIEQGATKVLVTDVPGQHQPLTIRGGELRMHWGDGLVCYTPSSGDSRLEVSPTIIDKLDGIEPGAEVNVQADWAVTAIDSPAYIQNKPNEYNVVAGDNIGIMIDNDDLVISASGVDLSDYTTFEDVVAMVSGVTGVTEYGQFYSTNITSAATMNKIKGTIEVTNDGKIKLKKGSSYHVTVRGRYNQTTAANTYGDISYIEYITNQSIHVNVDNTIAEAQYFELSYDLYKLNNDSNYYVYFSMNGGTVNDLFIEIHAIGSVGVGGSSGGASYTPGNGIDITNDVISWETTAGITDIQMVTALPQDPVSSVLYIIPEA